jgi:anti-sigma regulatory factor (Ser/Thr protein kinase)
VPPPSEQHEHPVRPVRSAGGAVGTALHLALDANWVAPSIARDRVESWLRGHRWPRAQVDELVLAVSEAVSNSVEHGYRVAPDVLESGERVEVRVRISMADDGYRRVEFVVVDHGAWREPVVTASTRGHGMLIMRSCTDELVVEGSPGGTTVVLRSRPTPPPR